MKRAKVKSSNIESIGYDEVTQSLQIKFFNGGLYQYTKVPKTIHKGLMDAESHGKFFLTEIKGKFDYEKIT